MSQWNDQKGSRPPNFVDGRPLSPEQIGEPLSTEEEAQVRLRAGHSIIWGPDTKASDPLVNDRLRQAVQDRRRLLATLDAALAAIPATPDVGLQLREAEATIEAMSGDAADLTDLISEAAAMRTVLGHLLGDDRGRIHDSGCGVCGAGRALLTAEHELPSFAATPEQGPGLDVRDAAYLVHLADRLDRDWVEGVRAVDTASMTSILRHIAARLAKESTSETDQETPR
jgi:hypothetical protein